MFDRVDSRKCRERKNEAELFRTLFSVAKDVSRIYTVLIFLVNIPLYLYQLVYESYDIFVPPPIRPYSPEGFFVANRNSGALSFVTNFSGS